MTEAKLLDEGRTLARFMSLYCTDKHEGGVPHEIPLAFEGERIGTFEPVLCDDCAALFEAALTHLKACPHDPKPRCRKCPAPCYGRAEWKQMARIMRYSGMKLGLTKLRKSLFRR